MMDYVSEPTTWDLHPAAPGKGRVWRRKDPGDWEYPWFYWLPNGIDSYYVIQCGSIARTWEEAMAAIQKSYVDRIMMGMVRSLS